MFKSPWRDGLFFNTSNHFLRHKHDATGWTINQPNHKTIFIFSFQTGFFKLTSLKIDLWPRRLSRFSIFRHSCRLCATMWFFESLFKPAKEKIKHLKICIFRIIRYQPANDDFSDLFLLLFFFLFFVRGLDRLRHIRINIKSFINFRDVSRFFTLQPNYHFPH